MPALLRCRRRPVVPARLPRKADLRLGEQGGGQRRPHYFRLKRLSLHVVQFKVRVAHSSVSCVATVVSCVATVGPSPGGILDAGSRAPEHRSPPANQVRGTSTVPSRSKMSRDAAPGPAGRSDAGAQEAYGPSVGGSVTDLLDPAAEPPQAGRPSGRTRGRVMRNWRVRSRLVLLITIPTATAVAIGGSSIASSWRSAVADQRITQLATLVSKVTTLSYQLQYERFDTVQFIGTKTDLQTGNLESTLSASAKDRLHAIRQQYKSTDKWIGLVTAGGGYRRARPVLGRHRRPAGIRGRGSRDQQRSAAYIDLQRAEPDFGAGERVLGPAQNRGICRDRRYLRSEYVRYAERIDSESEIR